MSYGTGCGADFYDIRSACALPSVSDVLFNRLNGNLILVFEVSV